MPAPEQLPEWTETIGSRYENYLKASFFFKDARLRQSFEAALRREGSLLKGPFPEVARDFGRGLTARELAEEYFANRSQDLCPALIDQPLYDHQVNAIRAVHKNKRNVVVATGTASGKTESFLYPILFDLYRQHAEGTLTDPGVRALILYPMNALANDQRERLGKICQALHDASSAFKPTFGQYIGQTPENRSDSWRHARSRLDDRRKGELVLRAEMRESPPHILLTNYSMLEYLLIRPDDSPLFDAGKGQHWQFIVLDEAHQYKGAKGMEMGMLIRRLKQRLREGGRADSFRCIATSATMTSTTDSEDQAIVADFAAELFGERFSPDGVIFGKQQTVAQVRPRRYHMFLRALEGAFLVHSDGADDVVLNRKSPEGAGTPGVPLEIALCRECGQHYYVGQVKNRKLQEAARDPSRSDFGVEYYLPTSDEPTHKLCRRCGELVSSASLECDCNATVTVKHCASHPKQADQLKKCEMCGYQRGGVGDPVQEIVHGTDGPNAVIATALHELLPPDRRKVLAFADSRQEAAFFAWYVEDSYRSLRDRNLIFRAIRQAPVDAGGLSIDDLASRLSKEWERAGLFSRSDTQETRNRELRRAILREALTDERRLSLAGVGLIKWFIEVPAEVAPPPSIAGAPWNFTRDETSECMALLIDSLRLRGAMELPSAKGTPAWGEVCPQRTQFAYSRSKPRGQSSTVREWGSPQSALVAHLLSRILENVDLTATEKRKEAVDLMKQVWESLRTHDTECNNDDDPILVRARASGSFRLNSKWLRVRPVKPDELWECDTCASVSGSNVRDICQRNRCPGNLSRVDTARIQENHYRILYESTNLPPALTSEEHTAQIESNEAQRRQDEFKNGSIHLLSSSTTFEVGVDLGDLEVVFLRNVPPEPFSYTQRVGRAGRRELPGIALTYCRRNPHDLYHYENPEERVIKGAIRSPRLQMTNQPIILRHIVATAFSKFFRAPENSSRFETLESFIGDWSSPSAASDLRSFCATDSDLRDSLYRIVPNDMHTQIGLDDDSWINKIAGDRSRLATFEAAVCEDRNELEELIQKSIAERDFRKSLRLEKSKITIEKEQTLTFLSRKAIIPKYGFPVDVVELDTRHRDGAGAMVSLQRDLSQAIAEYAPGGKVVANKLEWESCGVKVIPDRALPTQYYRYDEARNFEARSESEVRSDRAFKKYLVPQFGFVTPLLYNPREPQTRAKRLYTTRPFFRGFDTASEPVVQEFDGVSVTQAVPGSLVILCEGKNKQGFYICLTCGSHSTGPESEHVSPAGSACKGTLGCYSLAHELHTDVVRLDFRGSMQEDHAYSVGYAILLGAAESLDVPSTDLNVTVGPGAFAESAIVLYDDVPGGAGLVAQLEERQVFRQTLGHALDRVSGACGCDFSCYGCLRSYRNQFVHTRLNRLAAHETLRGLSQKHRIRNGK